MDSENAISNADFFLHEIPAAKINNNMQIKKKVVKEELQFLHLGEEKQKDILKTLKFIHGNDLILKGTDQYDNLSTNLKKKYWIGQGSLVVKGGCNFSQSKNDVNDDSDRIKQFALLRLISYGFHENHCVEALNYSKCDVEDSIFILYNKYFNCTHVISNDYHLSASELLEIRTDEKSSLESIYESSFCEKVLNSVWIITLKLDYLINLYHNKKNTKSENLKNVKKKEKCRGFIRGHCSYGAKCRFSHEKDEVQPNLNSHLEDFNFDLEIRFPNNTKYPFEAPLIFLKTNAILPPLINLHICKYLHNEAKDLALNGIPSIYSVTELLKNESETLNHLKKEVKFISSDENLFACDNLETSKNENPSHYIKGLTYRDNKMLNREQIATVDESLVDKFGKTVKSKRYTEMIEKRKALPAWHLKNEIVNRIQSSQITMINGETGCGKSTQIPQFILDEWLSNYHNKKQHVEIVCTQPRRISAIGVAERVAEERLDRIGNMVGYQIRLENKVSQNTRLTFCTTGILLRRLECEPYLSNITHIIVDEIHERSEEIDFLLMILKELLPLRPDLKVILMSATVNTKIFSDYFGDIPIVKISGRTFPVTQFFLEDILETTGYVLELGSDYARKTKYDYEEIQLATNAVNAQFPENKIKDENLNMMQTVGRYINYSMKTCMNLFLMDPDIVNNELIETLLMWIVSGDHKFPNKGTILIFLPGIMEIQNLYDQLRNHHEFGLKTKKYLLLPLHSSLTNEEQAAIFRKTDLQKIVLSTNIAETSVTIDDCTYVIDSGKMKEKHFDPNRNMESLLAVWVTKANALQRKGRAGRVMPGVCFHLYTHHRFEYHMLPQPIPEIRRIPLEQLILKIKILENFKNRDVLHVLDSFIEPPTTDHINSAIVRLQNVGALNKEKGLTSLGHHLAALPVDVRIGKLMLYGAIFGCVDAALTMAACLSHKSPFITPFGKKDLVNAKKKIFSIGNSDQITTLMAYKKWLGINKRSSLAGRNFSNENFLSYKTLITIADIKQQFLEYLVDIGFVPINLEKKRRSGDDNILQITGSEFNKNGENINVLASIICAALYPNIVKILTPSKSYVMSSVGAVPREAEAKELKFATMQEMVFMHPSSINHAVSNFPSPYMVYQEKIRTNRVFFKDCTMIPSITLVLFSGSDLTIRVHNDCTYISLENDWILFQVQEHKIAEMIKMIRQELFMLLEEKIKDPLLNIFHHDKGEKIISTILNLIK